jgi:hypothetical protein
MCLSFGLGDFTPKDRGPFLTHKTGERKIIFGEAVTRMVTNTPRRW